MMLSQEKRRYQREHAHYMWGKTKDNNGNEIQFEYGYGSLKEVSREEFVHGFSAGTGLRVIETVYNLPLVIGSVIKLGYNEPTCSVLSFKQNLIDEKQLRFVPYEKADKVTVITLSAIEGA